MSWGLQQVGKEAVPQTERVTEQQVKPAAQQLAQNIEPAVQDFSNDAVRPLGKASNPPA